MSGIHHYLLGHDLAVTAGWAAVTAGWAAVTAGWAAVTAGWAAAALLAGGVALRRRDM